MYDADDSEAAHMDEIHDGDLEGFAPYTQEEKLAYVKRRLASFVPSQVGKFVVMRKSDHANCPALYLVDRRKKRDMWWSPYARYAMVYDHKTAADTAASRLKYGHATVKRVTPNMTTGGPR